jgi:hypothetical protein
MLTYFVVSVPFVVSDIQNDTSVPYSDLPFFPLFTPDGLPMRSPEMPKFADLKRQGLTNKEIADTLGVSLRTVQRRLRNPGPPPPRYPTNMVRDRLVQEVWQLMVTRDMTRIAAARHVVQSTKTEILGRASMNKHPVTPERLARWSRPPVASSPESFDDALAPNPSRPSRGSARDTQLSSKLSL